MRMRWTWGVALAAGLLGSSGTALAQNFMPTPIGAARIPEPIPCGEQANLIPGPISPLAAPPGPPDCLSLPADRPNAFPCEKFPAAQNCYLSLGSQGLVRQKPGDGAIAVLDPVALKTGIGAPSGSPVLQQFNSINQDMVFGPKVTIGYLFNDSEAIEFTGWYLPDNYNTLETDIPGQIDSFFSHPPLGFEGDNGMWLHGDRLRTQFTTQFGSAELNYRYANKAIVEAEIILGLRYIDNKESVNIYSGDDDLTVRDTNGNPDPTRQASYNIEAHNHMLMPQFGFEYSLPATQYFTVGATAKAALGANYIDVNTKLNRGDGLVGFTGHRNAVSFGEMYDIGLFVDFHILERLRLRAGYNAMWLLGVATAVDNLDFNLANTLGNKSNYGSIFYQGPMLELQFLF